MTCTHYAHFVSLVPPLAERIKARLHTAPVEQSAEPSVLTPSGADDSDRDFDSMCN